MTPAVALRLGRVSNLPTVWTNTLAGIALAGVSPWHWATLPAAAGLSLTYVGGMYLNDAFDRGIDAQERPDRPIPAGQADPNTVFALGFGLLLGGAALLLLAACAFDVPAELAVLASLVLGGAILAYNWHHKGNPLGPLWMGACRLLAYCAAGLAAAASLPPALLAGALVSLCYLIGLTYAAKQEMAGRVERFWPLAFLTLPLAYGAMNVREPVGAAGLAGLTLLIGVALRFLLRRRPGDIPRAVVWLIAGIAVLDAMFLAIAGWPGAASVAFACFAATLLLQRWVRGT